MHPHDDTADLVTYWKAPPIKLSECSTAPTLTTDNSATEKLEKHVDELEEDIEFFNTQLKAQEVKVDAIEAKQCLQEMKFKSEITSLELKINALEATIAYLKTQLEQKIEEIENGRKS